MAPVSRQDTWVPPGHNPCSGSSPREAGEEVEHPLLGGDVHHRHIAEKSRCINKTILNENICFYFGGAGVEDYHNWGIWIFGFFAVSVEINHIMSKNREKGIRPAVTNF